MGAFESLARVFEQGLSILLQGLKAVWPICPKMKILPLPSQIFKPAHSRSYLAIATINRSNGF
jgi:hypothetical protein